MKLNVYFVQLFIVFYGVSAQRNCYFPEFLHTPTTSTWWSDISSGKNSQPYENIWWRKLSIENDRRRLYLRYLCMERLLIVDDEQPYCQGWQKIEINCVKTFGVRRHTYLVEVYKRNRKIYQCLKFKTMDEKPHEIFIFYQSKRFSYNPDDALCSEDQLFSTSMIWIPDIKKYNKRKWIPCPLNGGFQIKGMIGRYDSKERCTSSIYVNLECDCIVGEGCEWSFNEIDCNPFEQKSKSRFQCYSHWYSDGFFYTILMKKQPEDKYIVMTLKYKDEIGYPESKSRYEKFQLMTIYSGLHFENPNAQTLQSGMIDYSYKVYIRRSFGICDDEQETCEHGCKAHSSNQLFCHRTCPANGKNCDFINRDSCTFKDRYIGQWDLITTGGFGSIKIATNTITFNNTLSREKEVTLSCIRENNDIIQDLFILGMPMQSNGCRIQDVCIQFYQTSKNRHNRDFNTNTLFYKVSKSSRKGTDFDNLCNFDDDPPPLNDLYRSAREKTLVKHLNQRDSVQHSKVKCALYKINLVGNITFRPNRLWQCPVEVSDYNKQLVSTGEFDNILRISPGCQAARNISWMRLEHKCLSVLNFEDISTTSSISQITTFIKEINSYFCWLIVEKRVNISVLFEMYLFESPQCQYITKLHEGVTILKAKAGAFLTLEISKNNYLRRPAKLTQTSLKTFTVYESIKKWQPIGPQSSQQEGAPADDMKDHHNFIVYPSFFIIVMMAIISHIVIL